jgi:FMN phosphatase YigB (HAD superfamily)
MIGDHYEKDCIGAKDIGMMTIYYNARQIQGNFSRADAVINHMDELSNAIDKL